MSADLVVVVPVLDRPHRVAPTIEGFARTAPGCRVLFVADPDDADELAALRKAGAEFIAPGGNYASKIRAGVEHTSEPLIFTAADDLEPQDGWLEAAYVATASGSEVIGVNDLVPRQREHATHFLLTRGYAETPAIDGSPGPFFEGYSHWFCDDELIATARARGLYAYAAFSHVRHLHPFAGTADDDETYRRGRANRRADRRLFRQRSHLWT